MPFPILTSLIAVPVLGALALLALKDDHEHESMIRNVALAISGVVFALTILLR